MSSWDEAAGDYEAHWEATTGYTLPRLVDHLAPREGLHALDVAAGPGTVTMALAERGARVSACDLSRAMVERLLARAGELGFSAQVDARVADAQALPYPDRSFDAAASNFGVIFAPDVAAALAELVRVTRPGGRLAMTSWSLEARNGWSTLLEPDYEQVLGFALGPRPAYRWGSVEEFVAALAAAGWGDLDVETVAFPAAVWEKPDDVAAALDSPATRMALAALDPAQADRVRAYVVERARVVFGGGPVSLPREAWVARGRATAR